MSEQSEQGERPRSRGARLAFFLVLIGGFALFTVGSAALFTGGSALSTWLSGSPPPAPVPTRAADVNNIYVGSAYPTGSSVGCSAPDFSTDLSSAGSINEALDAALLAVDSDLDVIIICDGGYTYLQDITGYNDAYNITIRADEGADVTLDGDGDYRLLHFNAPVRDITISGITFQNGSAFLGGAIYVDGAASITVTDNIFSGNSATEYGGAIVARNVDPLTVTNSTFRGNTAPAGGAIFVDGGSLIVTSSTFTGNNASGGGAIWARNVDPLIVTSSTFTGNNASSGGAILVVADPLTATSSTFTDSTFTDNSAAWGGAIMVGGTSLTLTDNTFRSNRATVYGGAIFADVVDGEVAGRANQFVGNSAPSGGGADVALDSDTSFLALGQWRRLGAQSVVIIRN